MKLFVSYQPLHVYLLILNYSGPHEISPALDLEARLRKHLAAAKAALMLGQLWRGLKPRPFKTGSQPLIPRRKSIWKAGGALALAAVEGRFRGRPPGSNSL